METTRDGSPDFAMWGAFCVGVFKRHQYLVLLPSAHLFVASCTV